MDNPYLKKFHHICGEEYDSMQRMIHQRRSFLSEILAREILVRLYAWAVPTEEVIRTLVKHAPIVEIGAGTGYWAHLIHQMGGDILAYDQIVPQDDPEVLLRDCPVEFSVTDLLQDIHSSTFLYSQRVETLKKQYLIQRACHFPVQPGGPEQAAEHSDHSLFLCWPLHDDPCHYPQSTPTSCHLEMQAQTVPERLLL
mgnify:CR=1 FL=1